MPGFQATPVDTVHHIKESYIMSALSWWFFQFQHQGVNIHTKRGWWTNENGIHMVGPFTEPLRLTASLRARSKNHEWLASHKDKPAMRNTTRK
jgi:hypothetical protein